MNEVTIRYAHWAPVSAGEYDRRLRSIAVNLTVADEVHERFGHERETVLAAIVAHERVHLLSAFDAPPHEEERRARDAALAASSLDVVAHIDEVLASAWV